MTTIIGTSPITAEDVAAIARDNRRVALESGVIERLRKAHAVLSKAAASGQRIYGLNTGLGANLKAAVEDDAAAFQRQVVQGRSASVGSLMSREQVRATMAARIAGLAKAGSGISPGLVQALTDLLNAQVHPLMPSIGSIGVSDLLLLGPIARMLYGEGEVEYQSARMPASAALARLGMKPCELALKDGLALISASAASVGHGALAVVDARQAYRQQQLAAALTCEALGANKTVLDSRIHAARPGFGQVTAAAELRALLDHDKAPPPSSLQDPLSIRCLPVIHGVLDDAIGRAGMAVEIELNSATESPLVLSEDALVLSTPNFHTAALSLAFETLGIAIAQGAAACVARFILLTGSGRNGLPKYLSPVGGASCGFVPLQKATTAILAMIRHKANPVMLDFLPVSEGVEDHAAQTPLAVSKCADMIGLWQRLVAFEFLAAAQAVHLRGGAALSPAMQEIYVKLRGIVQPLEHDRPLGPDADAVYEALCNDQL